MVSASLTDRSYRPSPTGFSLAPAARDLFSAFAAMEIRPHTTHCTHCVSPGDESALAQPAEQLWPELVSRFMRKVGTTWGEADDLRRIAPRVLTLCADNRLSVSRELVWQKMRWARWQDWPPEQYDAIGRFLVAEFTRLLRVEPRPAHVAHRWLAQVSVGIDDLSGFLTTWHDSVGPLPDPAIRDRAVGHVVELLTSSPLRPDIPATMADVFRQNPGAADQVTSFLTGPGIDHDLRRAATERQGTAGERRISVAVERLRRFRVAVEQGLAPD